MGYVRVAGSDERLTVSKIVCVGQNYAEHVAEMNPGQTALPSKPVIFLKPPSAIVHDGATIMRPRSSKEMHHEVELIVVIGESGKRIKRSDAARYILGYGVGLDLTLRDLQAEAKKAGKPWSLAKGFDGSALISDIVPREQADEIAHAQLSLAVNAQIRQSGFPSEMIFPLDRLIEYISEFMTLERGDVIYTGTPSGVGPLNKGDRVEARLGEWARVTALIDYED